MHTIIYEKEVMFYSELVFSKHEKSIIIKSIIMNVDQIKEEVRSQMDEVIKNIVIFFSRIFTRLFGLSLKSISSHRAHAKFLNRRPRLINLMMKAPFLSQNRLSIQKIVKFVLKVIRKVWITNLK